MANKRFVLAQPLHRVFVSMTTLTTNPRSFDASQVLVTFGDLQIAVASGHKRELFE